jgi:hypothetical protein
MDNFLFCVGNSCRNSFITVSRENVLTPKVGYRKCQNKLEERRALLPSRGVISS